VLLPLSILLENIGSVYTPVLAGARIIVPSPQESGISGSSSIDPVRLAAMLQNRQPTTLIVPPALLKLLVQHGRAGQLPASLRFIAVGGAPVGSALLRDAADLGLPVYQGYGLSEAGSVVAVNTPADNRPGSVGKPLPHSRVRIGSNGEIRIRGITFSGYVNGPVHAANTDLCTGDYGYLDDDGYLYVTGRMQDRIITPYGRNVAPEWVESELQAHPDIMQAAVLGNGLSHLYAVLVGRPGVSRQRLNQVVATVNARLPDYARIAGWTLADAPFSPADGTRSETGGLRRAVIEQSYAPRLAVDLVACHE
jgi:long-chain acyl-CoA synthetase